MSTSLGPELHSRVSADHLSATSFRQTSSSSYLTCAAGFPAQVLPREPPHWFVFNEESFRLSDIVSGLWVISGHLAQIPTSLLGKLGHCDESVCQDTIAHSTDLHTRVGFPERFFCSWAKVPAKCIIVLVRKSQANICKQINSASALSHNSSLVPN